MTTLYFCFHLEGNKYFLWNTPKKCFCIFEATQYRDCIYLFGLDTGKVIPKLNRHLLHDILVSVYRMHGSQVLTSIWKYPLDILT